MDIIKATDHAGETTLLATKNDIKPRWKEPTDLWRTPMETKIIQRMTTLHLRVRRRLVKPPLRFTCGSALRAF